MSCRMEGCRFYGKQMYFHNRLIHSVVHILVFAPGEKIRSNLEVKLCKMCLRGQGQSVYSGKYTCQNGFNPFNLHAPHTAFVFHRHQTCQAHPEDPGLHQLQGHYPPLSLMSSGVSSHESLKNYSVTSYQHPHDQDASIVADSEASISSSITSGRNCRKM